MAPLIRSRGPSRAAFLFAPGYSHLVEPFVRRQVMGREGASFYCVAERGGDRRDPLSKHLIAIGPSLVGARMKKEELQTEMLRMRIARERGELISRQAVIDACESAGRLVAHDLDAVVFWAEEIEGVSRTGGIPALMSLLRAKVFVLRTGIADKFAAAVEIDAADGGEGTVSDADQAPA